MQLDLAIMEAFTQPKVHPRWRSLLATPRGRAMFRERLAHDFEGDLDPRIAIALPPGSHNPEAIAALIRLVCRESKCTLISESSKLDGLELDIPEALGRIVGFGIGTIASVVPGVLAYFEPEDGRYGRYLLVADANAMVTLKRSVVGPPGR